MQNSMQNVESELPAQGPESPPPALSSSPAKGSPHLALGRVQADHDLAEILAIGLRVAAGGRKGEDVGESAIAPVAPVEPAHLASRDDGHAQEGRAHEDRAARERQAREP